MMRVCYDLACCPPSFDVVTCLLEVEQERLRRGEGAVEIEILPGPKGGFRDDELWPQSIDQRRRMLAQIVVPMCAMLPACRSVRIKDERSSQSDDFGFGQYLIGFHRFIAAMRASIRPLRPMKEWKSDPGLITLTLRECEHWPERNSKLDEWHNAALTLQMFGYRVVVVRDERLADGKLAGVKTMPLASRDLNIRAMLYRAAACNLFVSNGPAWFAMALDAPTVVVRPATEGISPLYSARTLERMGVVPGQQMAGAPPHQRLVWEDDTAGVIVAACTDFMNDAGAQRSAA